ncbi:hypothetical protein BG36_20015 [Aquamicrobium defluvii]|uniref:Uncharacterized protein n=1 Tax=Aquamicrobium defluvii TaxID=69279 RepID=A0A011U071_9HYPH|nr:hypothetical protein BG36_20015 [Aquamicrobium defluvii]
MLPLLWLLSRPHSCDVRRFGLTAKCSRIFALDPFSLNGWLKRIHVTEPGRLNRYNLFRE